MSKWKKVYFDLDNTLYDYEDALAKAIQDCYKIIVSARHTTDTHTVDQHQWLHVFKFYSDDLWPLYEQNHLSQDEYRRKRFLKTMEHFGLPARPEEADHFHELLYPHVIPYIKPFPYIHELLQLLNTCGVECGVITNGETELQRKKFDQLHVEEWLSVERLYISESVGLAKPDSAIFDKVRGSLPPQQALFIGDTWENDVVGPLDAGWDAVYFNVQHQAPTTNHEPLAEFRDSHDLLEYFKHKYEQV